MTTRPIPAFERALRVKKERALKEMKRRVRRHERLQMDALTAAKQNGKEEEFIPDIYVIKPRSAERREWVKAWLASQQFRFVRLAPDLRDFSPLDRPVMDRLWKAKEWKKRSGWHPLNQARGPMCGTKKWPWPAIPPFVIELALSGPRHGVVLDRLIEDSLQPIEQRFTLDEFLALAGLSRRAVEDRLSQITPHLPLDLPTFIAGMRRALCSNFEHQEAKP